RPRSRPARPRRRSARRPSPSPRRRPTGPRAWGRRWTSPPGRASAPAWARRRAGRPARSARASFLLTSDALAGGLGGGALERGDQPVRVLHVGGELLLRLLEHRVLLGPEAVERLQRLLGPLVGDAVLARLGERGRVRLHRLVLQRGGLLGQLVLVQ